VSPTTSSSRLSCILATFKKVERLHGSFWVYLLLCDDGSYYTGYSSAPISRFVAHMKGHGASYTRMHKPTGIAYVERHRTRRAAMKREREIKALTHDEKRILAKRASGEENSTPFGSKTITGPDKRAK
jgi:putative endonuclease